MVSALLSEDVLQDRVGLGFSYRFLLFLGLSGRYLRRRFARSWGHIAGLVVGGCCRRSDLWIFPLHAECLAYAADHALGDSARDGNALLHESAIACVDAEHIAGHGYERATELVELLIGRDRVIQDADDIRIDGGIFPWTGYGNRYRGSRACCSCRLGPRRSPA